MRDEERGTEKEREEMARTDLLFGSGCRLTERLNEGQVLVGSELKDKKHKTFLFVRLHGSEMLVWVNVTRL